MLIRRLVIAGLVAGAASAQAGTIPTQPAQPTNVISGWTTGNGTDVLGSGVLQGGNLNLVAGVAHSAGASLSDILYGKVAGSVQQVEGQTKLFFQRGIEGNYLLASGHGILAATAGPGKSVVGSADGAIISEGVSKAPMQSGGGGKVGGGVSGGTPGSSSGDTTIVVPMPAATPGLKLDNAPIHTIPGSDNGMGNGIGNGGVNGNGNDNAGGVGSGGGAGVGNTNHDGATEIPEPSSIALMLLGMVGAGALSRRRSR